MTFDFRGNRLASPVIADVTPVPLDMTERVWPAARSLIRGPKFGIGREYDVDRLHGRLLLGVDRLWIAGFQKVYKGTHPICGLVITSIGPPPKDRPDQRFKKGLFFKEKSITVHLIAGERLYTWIDDAVEKISAYAQAQGCRQAFILARRRWRRYAIRFYPRFEKMGLARDRFEPGCSNMSNGRRRPGHFLLVEPMPPGKKYDTARSSRTYNYIRAKEMPLLKGEAHAPGGYRPESATQDRDHAQGPDRGAAVESYA